MYLLRRLSLLWLLVLAGGVAGLCLGAQDYSFRTLWAMVTRFNPSDPAQAIMAGMRLPRILAAVVVGAALAVAGVVMQAITRNPLADPGLTGVNAGAALAVVLGLFAMGAMSHAEVTVLSLAGAGLATVIVRLLAGDGDTTLRLPLAGAAFGTLCLSVVGLIVLLDPETRNIYRFWMVGSLGQADLGMILRLAPVAATGIAIALLAARPIEALMLGHEMGQTLGIHAGRILAFGFVAVAMTAGASVAIAGPVGFVGLIAPHLARHWVREGLIGHILAACPIGAGLAVFADLLGRWLARPAELQLGIVLAMIGAPAFMILVRRMLRDPA